jgi:hypothetical protein
MIQYLDFIQILNTEILTSNAKGHPFPAESLNMAELLSQHKMINRLTEFISKHESLDNNNKEVKSSKEREQEELGRENTYIRLHKKERKNSLC